jgi:2'-5' RNA ligase
MPKKNPDQFSLFPETLYEYHILLSPSDAIKEDVDNLKQQLHELIGIAARDLQSIAHITLLKMEAFESTDVKVQIKKAVTGFSKFTIKVNGHSQFENGSERTVVLKIDNPHAIDDLVAAIKKPNRKRAPKVVNRQTSIIDKPSVFKPKKLGMTPHITIARNIPASDLEKIEDLTPFEYTNEWVCDRITIRRRIAGTDKLFTPAGEVKLG